MYNLKKILNNSDTQLFSTPLIKGDTAIIEYYQPAGTEFHHHSVQSFGQ